MSASSRTPWKRWPLPPRPSRPWPATAGPRAYKFGCAWDCTPAGDAWVATTTWDSTFTGRPEIVAAGHGGQVLLSEPAQTLVVRSLPTGVSLRDLGEHRLKDLSGPEHLYQLVIPGLEADFPPLRSLTVPHNLPVQLTRFIGRDEELAEVAKLLRARRLLTLTGAGGTGKTRLALQVAAEVAPEFPDGVFFVPLASYLKHPGAGPVTS